MRGILPVLTLALTAVVPGGVSAQVEAVGGVGRYFLDIDLLPDAGDGWGFDGSLLVGLGERVRVGAGVQYQAHSVTPASDRYEVVVPFGELRAAFPTGGPWRPFVAGRVGAVRHTLHVFGRELTGTGRVLGGLAGVRLRLSGAVGLEAAAAYYHATVEDLDFEGQDVPVSVADLVAEAVGLRLAVAWRPGG